MGEISADRDCPRDLEDKKGKSPDRRKSRCGFFFGVSFIVDVFYGYDRYL